MRRLPSPPAGFKSQTSNQSLYLCLKIDTIGSDTPTRTGFRGGSVICCPVGYAAADLRAHATRRIDHSSGGINESPRSSGPQPTSLTERGSSARARESLSKSLGKSRIADEFGESSISPRSRSWCCLRGTRWDAASRCSSDSEFIDRQWGNARVKFIESIRPACSSASYWWGACSDSPRLVSRCDRTPAQHHGSTGSSRFPARRAGPFTRRNPAFLHIAERRLGRESLRSRHVASIWRRRNWRRSNEVGSLGAGRVQFEHQLRSRGQASRDAAPHGLKLAFGIAGAVQRVAGCAAAHYGACSRGFQSVSGS